MPTSSRDLIVTIASSSDRGAAGRQQEAWPSCTVTDNGDGTKTITCEDGTTATVSDGQPGASCTATDNLDGTKTITCDDGTSVTVSDGNRGLGEGETLGLVAMVSTSTPANGTYFAAGETIVITIELTDFYGDPLTVDDLSLAWLLMNGPRETLTNVTASALLNTSTDRAAHPHHYIDLTDLATPGLVLAGNQLEYTTQAITTEAPGTYTIGVWGMSANFELDRVFELAEVQIGTATVEPEIVGNCGDCHLGAASGQMYLHHTDQGRRAIDWAPITNCRMCHNHDGYASVRKCDDGSSPQREGSAYICQDLTENWSYVPDTIVRRVHGVHMGEHLLSDFNTNPSYGDFHMYEGVVFPANVKNCVKCHTDDSWKNAPSREACGACHDNLDFATGDYVPYKTAGMSSCTVDADCSGVFSGFNGLCDTTTGDCELRTHGGGAATNDTACAACHTPDTGGLAPISVVHDIPAPAFSYGVNLSMTPPNNGTHYVAGESPVVTVQITDSSTTNPVNPANITEATFGRA